MAHRRRRRSAPSRTREVLVVAIAIEKDLPERGRGSVEGGRTRVDWLTPHLTPYPRRRLGSDLQNSGLFFSSALVRKNAACLSSSPAARHRSPTPTAHRPSTAPAAQSIGWRTHRAGKRRSTQTDGVRGLSTLKLAKTTPLISLVPRLRSCPRSEATCTGEQRWWEGASTRRVVAARASSVVGGRKWATIGLFNHALCFPQRLWALGSTREKSSSRLAALAQRYGARRGDGYLGRAVGMERIVAT